MDRSALLKQAKMELGAVLRKSRDRAGLARQAVAGRLGVSTQTIYNWEAGRYAPDDDSLRELARVYGMGEDEFLHAVATGLHPGDGAPGFGPIAGICGPDCIEWGPEGRPGTVAVLAVGPGFAEAHGLLPGDRIGVDPTCPLEIGKLYIVSTEAGEQIAELVAVDGVLKLSLPDGTLLDLGPGGSQPLGRVIWYLRPI